MAANSAWPQKTLDLAGSGEIQRNAVISNGFEAISSKNLLPHGAFSCIIPVRVHSLAVTIKKAP